MPFSISAPTVEYDDIATEVAEMSQEEQEAARGDLCGERPLVPESEEMIQSSLQELEECIESIHPKEAYETAQVICPEYASSRDFRLMFLRCERFNATKAAQKIVNYWDGKVGIFGEDRAFRQLTLEDFDNEDQRALTMGGIQILPERDDAGRGIIFSHRARWDNRRTHTTSVIRQFWYVVHAALEDANIQRKGVIFLVYNGIPSFDHTKTNAKLGRKMAKIIRDMLPIRIVATHQIISSPLLKIIAENGLFWIGREWRARYKQHSGIKYEYLASLGTYGIQRAMLPQVLGGELEFNYEEWLANRRVQGR